MVERGARLIATNMDSRCPTESGVRPGCGAIVAMIEKATGREAFSVGKPSPVMMRFARKELNLRTEDEEIADYAYRPDYVAPSVAELPEELFRGTRLRMTA